MKNSTKGFSLIELLTVLALIGILLVGVSRIDFNPQIDRQKSLEFSNGLSSTLENIRNDALYGKGVGPGRLIHPNYWEIELRTGTGFNVRYSTGGALQVDTTNSFSFPPRASISQIRCNNLARTSPESLSGVIIRVEGSQLSLSGCTANRQVLEISTLYSTFSGSIVLNAVTGTIEKIKK